MKKIIAFVIGLFIILLPQLLLKIQVLTGIMLSSKIYFLGKVLPFLNIGYILTDFLIVFITGLVVSFIDKKYNFKKLLAIILVSQILTAIFYIGTPAVTIIIRIIIRLVLFSIYINLGGFIYKTISKKNNEVQL